MAHLDMIFNDLAVEYEWTRWFSLIFHSYVNFPECTSSGIAVYVGGITYTCAGYEQKCLGQLLWVALMISRMAQGDLRHFTICVEIVVNE